VAQVVYPDSRDTGGGAEPVEVVEDGFGSQWGAVRLAEHQVAGYAERGLPAGCRLKAETTRFDSPTQAWLDLVFGVVMTGVVLRMLDRV
jgi:hypothetical protein